MSVVADALAGLDPTGSTAGQRFAVRAIGLSKRFRVRRRWSEIVARPRAARFTSGLQDVTLDVRAGEFFGILGPNGAGKTTLFRILAASLLPDAGDAFVLGHHVESESAAVRRLVGSAISDERSLHWRLSARENLRMFASLHGFGAAKASARIDGILQLVGLDRCGDAPVASFSSGMKQRLLIARALLPGPRVLLLDEPTRSLDPIVARDFRRFLRDRLVGEEGCTVLLATHSGEEAMALCDRVAVLDKGRVLAVGTPDAIGRAVGDQRFSLWTRTPEHAAFARMSAQGMIAEVVVTPSREEEGWACVQLSVPGGIREAARILDLLHCAGLEIGRFERTPLTLADLIERVVRRSGADCR